MPVAVDHVPSAGGKARLLIGHIGQRDLAVDGDAVVVPQHDQPRQFQLARQRNRLLADALHQAAVTRDHPGAVVDQLGPHPRPQGFLGDGEADGIGQPLAQGAGRGLDPRRMAVLGVPGGDRPPLPERLDLGHRHVGIAGQVQQGIEQHRPMPRRQDEPVAVGPVGRACVIGQVTGEQHRRHVGHPHRHPRMPRIGRRHRIQRQRANGTGHAPVFGVTVLQGGDVQGRAPRVGGAVRAARTRKVRGA